MAGVDRMLEENICRPIVELVVMGRTLLARAQEALETAPADGDLDSKDAVEDQPNYQ